MKKLLVFAVALAASIGAQAQTTWGVKAGLDLSNYQIGVDGLSAQLNPGTKAGFYVGAVNNVQFCDKFGLQTELMYNYNGFRLAASEEIVNGLLGETGEASLGNLSAGVTFHTLRLPVMVKFQPAEGLSILAGPYLSLRMGTGLRFNENTETVLSAVEDSEVISAFRDGAKTIIDKSLHKFDVGAALGVEYAFKNGLFIDLRYNISFLNSLKNEIDLSALEMGEVNLKDEIGAQPTVKYSSFQIGVGFRF